MPLTDFEKSLLPKNYILLRQMLKEVSGLNLTDNKMYLVETRLQSVARQYKYNTLNQLVDGLRGPHSQKLRIDIAEAMATPETFFFRDTKPFNQFKSFVLPRLIERNKTIKHLNIWCGACSSGQEPYSLAMILEELKHTVLKGWSINIIASDFSEKILTKARAGIYSQFEVQRGLPVQYLMKYFKKESDGWHIKTDIKSKVTFKNFNLLKPATHLGKFDVIFCRNVLFYFEVQDKINILSNISTVLKPQGLLFLGAAESTVGVSALFSPIKEEKGIYGKVQDVKALSA